ncbi:MAG: hypothetical protein KAS12_01300 [Candidatus Aenigmarchaeota archaeon]|nr:hypothetical protein [Candidatus Aenigmarchaeota archaeon]
MIPDFQKIFPDFQPILSFRINIKNTKHLPGKDYVMLSRIAEQFFEKRMKKTNLFLKNKPTMCGVINRIEPAENGDVTESIVIIKKKIIF